MSLFQFPIGAPQDIPFTDQDLLNVDHEFVTEGAYFGNDGQTVICIPSVLNPAIQWCSTKAEPPSTPAYVAIPTIHQPNPCPPPHNPVTTPEPSMVWLVLVVAAVTILWVSRHKIRKFISGYRRLLEPPKCPHCATGKMQDFHGTGYLSCDKCGRLG